MPPRDALSELRLALGLLAALDDGAVHSVQDLAARLGASAADIERVATTLTLVGLPPYSPLDLVDIELGGDRISLVPGSGGELSSPARLTLAEAEALRAALTLLEGRLEPETSGPVASLCRKVEQSLVGAGAPLPIAAVPGDENPDVLAALRLAVWGRERVTIEHYSAPRGETRPRVTDPLALVDRGGEWYLLAHCHDAGARRVFKVSRIRKAASTGETFEPPADVDFASWARDPFGELDAGDRATVRLRGEAARRARERWPEWVVGNEGGSILLEIPYADDTWIIGELLPWAGEVVVEAPADLREAFERTLESLAARYRG
jgi:predicted DNA-binding transcriptional regulator YafY